MNDFTKEELKHILNGDIELYPSTFSDLRDKIQSMIDNYCEHKKYVENIVTGWQCEKCGVLLND